MDKQDRTDEVFPVFEHGPMWSSSGWVKRTIIWSDGSATEKQITCFPGKIEMDLKQMDFEIKMRWLING